MKICDSPIRYCVGFGGLILSKEIKKFSEAIRGISSSPLIESPSTLS